MPSEVETMFTARKPAWHGLGVMTPDALTSRDAIVKAGLDWTVSTRPLFTGKLNTDGVTDLIDVNDHYATVRDSDDLSLIHI